MKKSVDNKVIKNILCDLGPKPGKLAVNVAGFVMIPPMLAFLYSLADPNISKLLLLLVVLVYILAQPTLSILEEYFGIVTKFLKTKSGNNPIDNMKDILVDLGPKPGKIAVNVAGFVIFPPILALYYSLVDPITSKLLILLYFLLFILAQPMLAILEEYFSIVTKLFRSKLGHYIFCR